MNLLRNSLLPGCVLLLGWIGPPLLLGAGGEKSLLDKYQKKNQQSKEQLKAAIQDVLKKASNLEVKYPEKALELVREARDRLIATQLFTQEEEKEFYKPLWDRIEVLKELVQEHRVDKMARDLSKYKDSIQFWSDQLDKVQEPGTYAPAEATKTVPLTAALIAFRNGTYSFCLLRPWPQKTVACTVDGQEKIFLTTEVLGVKIQSGYYLFNDQLNRFVYVTNSQAFILTAPTRLAPSLPELPGPEPVSIIPKGSSAVKPEMVDGYVKAVFVKGPQQLARYFAREKGFTGEVGAVMRAARDALIETQIKKYLPKASADSRSKFQRTIADFLNSQPGTPLTGRQQEQLLYAMDAATPNAGRWPQFVLDFVNDLVQPNSSPRHE